MKNRDSLPDYAGAAFERREDRWSHITYNRERESLELVKSGEVARLKKVLETPIPRHTGNLSDHPHRQAMYEFVAAVTLATRFAVEGGLANAQAYTFSDAYIKLADKMKKAEEVHALYNQMMIDFATRVKRAKNKQKKLSRPIVRCMACIEGHLHEKLSLDAFLCGWRHRL